MDCLYNIMRKTKCIVSGHSSFVTIKLITKSRANIYCSRCRRRIETAKQVYPVTNEELNIKNWNILEWEKFTKSVR
jgi:hypothetical protein